MHKYGINGVSKRVNIMSERINIASVNVALRKYRIMQPWSRELRTSRCHAVVFLIAENRLEFFVK